MKQMVQLSIFLAAILVASSFANATAEKLQIQKSTPNIRELANRAEEESSLAARSLRPLLKDEDESRVDESREVLEYVEAELGHSESSTASHSKFPNAKSPN